MLEDPEATNAVRESLLELSHLAATMSEILPPQIVQAAVEIADCLLSGHKLLVCGNGGSAADAQHFVAELVGRMGVERRPLPAIALTADTSVLTALGNDYGYEALFARQVAGLAQTGDVLLVISTSGYSTNIIKAVEVARDREIKTIALLGNGGDPALTSCGVAIHIPTANHQRIQEMHIAALHAICEYVEKQIVDCAPQFPVSLKNKLNEE